MKLNLYQFLYILSYSLSFRQRVRRLRHRINDFQNVQQEKHYYYMSIPVDKYNSHRL